MIPDIDAYCLPTSVPASKVAWRLEPGRAALLIHDMQDYFLDFYGPASPLVAQLVANIRQLKQLCRSQGVPVFYTAQPGQQSPADRALLTDVWGPGITRRPERSGLVKGLEAEDGDKVLVKHRYSAFQRSTLQADLQGAGRDQLVICGIYAHIGCLVSAMDAFMMDIQPFFVADCLADFTQEQHNTALSTAAECCAYVVLLSDLRHQMVEHELRQVVRAALDGDDDWPEDDDNLVDYGVTSVQIMALVGRWRPLCPGVDFVALGQTPTMQSWRTLLMAA